MKAKLHARAACHLTETRYFEPLIGAGHSTEIRVPIAAAGTVRKLRVQLLGSPSADGFTFTVRRGVTGGALSNTALTTTVLASTPNLRNADLSNAVHFDATDTVSVSIAPSGTPTVAPVASIELECEGDSGGTSVWFGANGSVNNNSAYLHPAGYYSQCDDFADEHVASMVISCAGTITNFAAYATVSPGAGNSRTVTIRKNFAPATGATSLTWSNETGLKSASQNITVSEGDIITLGSTWTNTPPGTSLGWSICFVPDTAGNFIIPSIGRSGPASSMTRWWAAVGIFGAPNSTESVCYTSFSDEFTVTALAAWLELAPGGGAGRTFSLRENEGTPTPNFAVAFGAAESGAKVTTGTFTPTLGNNYDVQIAPSGSPETTGLQAFSLLGTITAGAAYAGGYIIVER
jgi:hypothetical protein